MLNGRPGRSFADIPATVERLLTGAADAPGLAPDVLGGLDGRWERVVLVLVDAFGWAFAERHADHPFLRRAAAGGVVSELASQFPSTTSAHVATIHSGLPVGATGVYEWFQYEPALGRVIAPLLFSFAGDARRETLPESGFTAAQLYPAETVYQRLAAAGVPSLLLGHVSLAGTTVTRWLSRGTRRRGFATLAELQSDLRTVLAEPGHGYVSVYVDDIDTAGHVHGPASAQFDAAVRRVLDLLEFVAGAAAGDGETLLIVTADHGQVAVDRATTVFVNVAWPGIAAHLRHGADGRPLAPCGSARDLFLHAAPGHVEELVEGLASLVAERATVRRTADLLAEGVFGDAGEALRSRVGDVVVLPEPGESAWWYEEGRFDMGLRGHHGGLSPDEMRIPLLALPL